MKRLTAILTAVAALIRVGAAAAPPAMPMLASPPKADGVIDPAEWRGALRVTDFHQTTKHLKGIGVPKALRTEAYVAQTRDAFHFAFRCYHDRMREIYLSATEHDGPVWVDDSVEVFLDAHGTRYSYYHIIANAAGCLTDAFNRAPKRRDATWDSDAVAAGRLHGDHYVVELSIPFNTLNLGLNRTGVIGLNLTRNTRYNVGRQSWRGGYHDPANAAAFRVAGVGPARFPVVVESVKWGEYAGGNAAEVQLRNVAARRQPLEVSLTVEQPAAGQRCAFERNWDLQGSAVKRLYYELTAEAPARCRVRILDKAGRLLAVVPRRIRPKPIASVSVESDLLLRTDRPRVTVRLNVPRRELSRYTLELALRAPDGRRLFHKGPTPARGAAFAESLDLSNAPADLDTLEFRTTLRNTATGEDVLRSRIPLRILPSPFK